jgi:FMN phosphatase YigB (HAD superfamily)
VSTDINKSLYQSAGHTLLGLQKLGYETSLDDFNKYVYGGLDYSILRDDLSDLHKHDVEVMKTMKSMCADNGVDVYIFSNAPDVWCDTVSEALFSFTFPTTSSFTNGLFKPNPFTYTKVDQHLNSDRYFFVDDKIINFVNMPKTGKWKGCWLNNEEMSQDNDILFAKDLSDVVNYVCTY